MYKYIYIYTYTYTHTYICICISICHTCIFTNRLAAKYFLYTSTCKYMREGGGSVACVWRVGNVVRCIFLYAYTCIHTHVYTYRESQIHTHTPHTYHNSNQSPRSVRAQACDCTLQGLRTHDSFLPLSLQRSQQALLLSVFESAIYSVTSVREG